MSFLSHVLSLLLAVYLLASGPVLVVATDVQDQTLGIDSSDILFTSGWTTVSNTAGTFEQTDGEAEEIEIFLPVGTVALSYVGFKQTGGALYVVCLDCGSSGQQLVQVNASDPKASSSTPVSLFSFSGLDPTTSHNLQVVNSADPAFGDTSTLTFKELVATVNTIASTSSSAATTSATTSSSSTSRTTSSSSSSDVSTSTTLSQSTSSIVSTSTTSTSSSASSSSSSTSTASAGSLSRSGLSTGTIVAAAVSSAAAVLLLLVLAIFLLYRARNRQFRTDSDSESIASASGLTRQISAPSIVVVPFEAAPSAAVSAYAPPGSATAAAFRPGASGSVRRRSYKTGPAAAGMAAGSALRDDDASSTSSVPARPRNPYEGVVRPDVPIDYPGHSPKGPGTPGTGRQRGMFR
ncbi:uncharacterized protein C8Q71DRAFT_92395 [Rhodofomes roseus]|uniref:Mid2 domain-containing protein n=1 Tax=Rhodofomes roseus TaxID=34475 RepID=A0ABQ8KDU2_9APHY|nr:uncharacterized protein C8Q71DRAFT_92395 [Rhodofomes roseus]KAH9835711.1 hypothetical protein C8Q71DRAFT_92395 [Rhodofomes roseus]